jgi:hypothetical protein
MIQWTKDEMTQLGNVQEMQIASLRRDGTRRSPATVWLVPYGDLCLRSVKGR